MSENNDLVQRLERLERENRRMKRAGVALVAVLGAALLMGQSPAKKTAPKVLQAQRFELVDKGGVVRSRLEVTSADVTQLMLEGPDGASFVFVEAGTRAAVTTSVKTNFALMEANPTGLAFNLAHGKTPGVIIHSDNNGSASVMIRGDKGPGITLGVVDRGPGIVIHGNGGEQSMSLLFPDGEPMLSDSNGRVRTLTFEPLRP